MRLSPPALDDGPDWIELANLSDQAIDIRGWVIEDDGENSIMFASNTIVPARGYLHLVRGVDFMFGLGKNDGLSLKTSDGSVVDRTQWVEGETSSGLSWARIPDMIGDFETTNQVTPAGVNRSFMVTEVCGDSVCDETERCDTCPEDCGVCAACPTDLFISEYVEGSGNTKAIELYNGTGADIDLSQYQLWNIANGGVWAESVTDFEGVLPSGQVWGHLSSRHRPNGRSTM